MVRAKKLKLDYGILVLASLALLAGLIVPILRNRAYSNRQYAGLDAIGQLFEVNFLAGMMLLLLPILLLGIIAVTITRVLRLPVDEQIRRAGSLTVFLAILRLNRGNLERDTSQLGLVLSLVKLGILFLLPILNTGNLSYTGGHTLLIFLGMLETALGVAYLPRIQQMIRHAIFLGYEDQTRYLDVINGRLIGAQPRLYPDQHFTIGQNNNNNLVLFDEFEVQDQHLCVYFVNGQAAIDVYGPILINGHPVQPGSRHYLRPGDRLQVGYTLIQYCVH